MAFLSGSKPVLRPWEASKENRLYSFPLAPLWVPRGGVEVFIAGIHSSVLGPVGHTFLHALEDSKGSPFSTRRLLRQGSPTKEPEGRKEVEPCHTVREAHSLLPRVIRTSSP